MKKRVFAVFIAVVMIATAINLAPLFQISADVTDHGTSASAIKGKIKTNRGHWGDGNFQYYPNDGEYNTYVSTTTNDPTRHVSVFNDCDNLKMLYSGTNTTKRGSFKTYKGSINTNDSDEFDNFNSAYPPNIIHSVNGSRSNTSGGNEGVPKTEVANGSDNFAKFYPRSTDMRMIFRNYFNTDVTYYNRWENNKPNPNADLTDSNLKPGLDISQYEYFEFKIYISSDLGLSGRRNSGASHSARVFFYHESNSATGRYLEWAACFDQYANNGSDFSFYEQLFDSNDNLKLATNQWHTIRIPLKNITEFAPVKQVTIRIAENMSTTNGFIGINDICFVKNPDHTKGVYYYYRNQDGSSVLDKTAYPSGNYFMINDFETLEGVKAIANNNTICLARRYEETNLDDFCGYAESAAKRGAVSGDNDFGYLQGSGQWPDGNYYYKATEHLVTQGYYSTVIQCRSGNYVLNQDKNMYIGATYYRDFGKTLDLSKYTHFAMDVYIRPISVSGRNKGIPGGGSASSFSLTLITDQEGTVDKETGFDINIRLSNTNINNGASFDGIRNTESGGPQFLPLDNQGSYGGAVNTGRTPYGAMRIIFTREDALKYFTNGSGADLSKINAMRFLWVNGQGDAGTTFDKQTEEGFDFVLDNFIAYTPETSMTIESKMENEDWDDNDVSFVYDIYGGYEAKNTESPEGKNNQGPSVGPIYAQKGDDIFTKDVDTQVTLKPGQKVTIEHLPFNSFYITQQNWNWRYKISSVTSDRLEKQHFGGANNERWLYSYTIDEDTNTLAIQPQVSWCCLSTDGQGKVHSGHEACKYNAPIYTVMKQRNFTITITHSFVSDAYTGTHDKWLDGSGITEPNNYN